MFDLSLYKFRVIHLHFAKFDNFKEGLKLQKFIVCHFPCHPTDKLTDSNKSSAYGANPNSRRSQSPADGSKRSLKVQYGGRWLAQGRDLHSEDVNSRPARSQVPGWKEGIPSRPTSGMSRLSSASGRSVG